MENDIPPYSESKKASSHESLPSKRVGGLTRTNAYPNLQTVQLMAPAAWPESDAQKADVQVSHYSKQLLRGLESLKEPSPSERQAIGILKRAIANDRRAAKLNMLVLACGISQISLTRFNQLGVGNDGEDFDAEAKRLALTQDPKDEDEEDKSWEGSNGSHGSRSEAGRRVGDFEHVRDKLEEVLLKGTEVLDHASMRSFLGDALELLWNIKDAFEFIESRSTS
jgi:hypothetical protein